MVTMSTATNKPTVSVPVPTEVPDKREYDSEDLAEVDRKLCEAIAAAETIGNDFLQQLLAIQVGTHYYETR